MPRKKPKAAVTPQAPRREWIRPSWLAGLGVAGLVVAVAWTAYFGWAMGAAADAVDRNFREGSGRPADFRPGGLFLEQDTYYWLGYVMDQRREGSWRPPRWTHRDNTPDGREVHWASPFFWVMRGTGELVATVRGLPFQDALERGARGIGPGLHLVAVLVGAVLLGRRYGWLASGAFAIALTAQRESLWAFHPLRPDHQALYGATIVLSAVLLLMGGLGEAVENEDARRTRRRHRWFAAAGLVGALGIWVSATVSVVFHLLVVGVVGLTAVWLRLHGIERSGRYDPQVWRVWGVAGAMACLIAWVIEYAPALPWTRLEVNHPLHALQWLAAGEALRLWTGWLLCGEPWSRARLAAFGTAAAGIVVAPLLLAFGPAELHALRDPVVRGIHRHISEFQTYATLAAPHPFRFFLITYGPLLIPMVLAPLLIYLRGVPDRLRLPLGLFWGVTALLLALGLAQARWMLLFAGLLAVLGAVTCAALAHYQGRGALFSRALAALIMLGFLGHAGWLIQQEFRFTRGLVAGKQIDPHFINAGCQKMLALDLGNHRADADWRFLADSGYAPYLHYFAGIPSAPSLYWENGAGIEASTVFFNDEAGDRARAIARERGLTHILLPLGPETVRMYRDLAGHGMEDHPDPTRRSLVTRIITDAPDLPLWILPDFALQPVVRSPRPYLDTHFQSPIGIYRLNAR